MTTLLVAQAAPIDGGALHARVDALFAALREQGRRAVRIVDLDCGTGRRIRRVARRARALGFVSVEARGCARGGREAAAATRAGAARPDPAVGFQFDATDPDAALLEERDDADLVIAQKRLAPISDRSRSGRSRA
jgi:hypothetical protein